MTFLVRFKSSNRSRSSDLIETNLTRACRKKSFIQTYSLDLRSSKTYCQLKVVHNANIKLLSSKTTEPRFSATHQNFSYSFAKLCALWRFRVDRILTKCTYKTLKTEFEIRYSC